jgi:hypothetical protein
MATSVAIRLRALAEQAKSLMPHRGFNDEDNQAAWSQARREIRDIGVAIEELLPTRRGEHDRID